MDYSRTGWRQDPQRRNDYQTESPYSDLEIQDKVESRKSHLDEAFERNVETKTDIRYRFLMNALKLHNSSMVGFDEWSWSKIIFGESGPVVLPSFIQFLN